MNVNTKKICIALIAMFLAWLNILISCKKEFSCENCAGEKDNKPPVAIAKPDTIITLPVDSILLDGSSSYDPDGTITSFQWTKISGPVAALSNSSGKKTVVKNLVAGNYQFELKVTDNDNNFAKDTVRVTVDAVLISNHAPVAIAGPDQTIILPTNSTTIDGSASYDVDNNISSYLWTKISGPSPGAITNANVVQTQINNLVQGVYQFELKVTDAGNLYSRDTLNVIVNNQPPPPSNLCDSNRPHVNAQLIPIATLSEPRWTMSVASAGNKILFAGGYKYNSTVNGPSSRIDIYDIQNQSWSTAELCVARNNMATAVNGNKIFFGGGEAGDGTWPVDSVDIFDVSSNSWSVGHLSIPGHGIAGGSVGDKVFFAGGAPGFTGAGRETRVDIFNVSTGTWSTSQLSEMKEDGHAAVTVGNKIYIAGGFSWASGVSHASNEIDIYDNNTNSWSTGTMSEGKGAFAAIASGEKIYWGGGSTGSSGSYYTSCVVNIFDAVSGSGTNQNLFEPTYYWVDEGQNAVLKDNKIIFFRTSGSNLDKFDIYDIASNTWSIGVLPQPLPSYASIISVNNTIYIAGGLINGNYLNASNQVYILQF